MKKILTNISKETIEIELSGGKYDKGILQIFGGRRVEFDYDVSVTVVPPERGKDLRIDTYM